MPSVLEPSTPVGPPAAPTAPCSLPVERLFKEIEAESSSFVANIATSALSSRATNSGIKVTKKNDSVGTKKRPGTIVVTGVTPSAG